MEIYGEKVTCETFKGRLH